MAALGHHIRMRRSQLIEWLGVDELRLADGPVEGLVEATLAAAALDDLRGASRQVIAARCAIVDIVGDRLCPAELAALLEVHPWTLFRLKRRAADPQLIRAIRLQLGARSDLRTRTQKWHAGKAV